jgi:hypothetical protein
MNGSLRTVDKTENLKPSEGPERQSKRQAQDPC